jgi:hypothetical protein
LRHKGFAVRHRPPEPALHRPLGHVRSRPTPARDGMATRWVPAAVPVVASEQSSGAAKRSLLCRYRAGADVARSDVVGA